MQVLFPLGQLTATPGALERAAEHGIEIARLIVRHQTGDWGEHLPADDQRRNKAALTDGSRIFSDYGEDDARLWIITEADRSVTTVLRPEDY